MRQFLHLLGWPIVAAAVSGAMLPSSYAFNSTPSGAAPMAIAAFNRAPEIARPGSIAENPADLVPVIRYGRYTLVELVPEAVQRDLLQQVVEVDIPSSLEATVGDALRHVLLRSGFQLCSAEDAAILYALPLPAVHFHLGPLALRDALLTLAGPAWEPMVDDILRQVCFRRRTAFPSVAAPATDASTNSASGRQAGRQEVQP